MKKESRQVRRARERVADHQVSPNQTITMLTVALFAVGLIVVIVVKLRLPLPTVPASPPSITPSIVAAGGIYPTGFAPCAPAVEDDPIVDRVRNFVARFSDWYEMHNPSAQLAKREVDRQWEELVVDAERFGLRTKGLPHQDVKVAQRNAICAYLEAKGWWLDLSLNWVSDETVEPHICVGRLVARRNGTVERRDKSTEPFSVYIFESDRKLGSISTMAVTTGHTIVLFPEAHDTVADDVLAQCRLAARSLPAPQAGIRPYVWAQFKDEYSVYGDTPALRAVVHEQLVLATFAHEVQHVADQQIQLLDTDTRVTGRTRGQLHGLAEARAILRQMAWGPLPILDLGNTVVNFKGTRSAYGMAVILIEDCFGQLLDTVALDEQRVRYLAVQSLNALELQLPQILRFAYEPDMLDALRQSLKTKGR